MAKTWNIQSILNDFLHLKIVGEGKIPYWLGIAYK